MDLDNMEKQVKRGKFKFVCTEPNLHPGIINLAKDIGIFTNVHDSLILYLILSQDFNTKDLLKIVGERNRNKLSRNNLWKHLNKLEELKYIERVKEGRNVIIKITERGKSKIKLYEDIVNYADKRLDPPLDEGFKRFP